MRMDGFLSQFPSMLSPFVQLFSYVSMYMYTRR